MQKKLDKISLFQVFSIVWLVIISGGVIFNAQENTSFYLVIDACIVFVQIFKYPKNIRSLFLRTQKWIFFILLFIGISLHINGDYDVLLTYAQLFIVLLLSFTTCAIVSHDQFLRIFVKTTLVLSAISLVFFLTPLMDMIRNSLPIVRFFNYDFRNAIVYLSNDAIPDRNSSIFSEPGLFQVYISLSLFVLLNTPHKIRYKYLYITILLVAVYTTKSTTGYIITVFVLVSQMFQGRYAQHNRLSKYSRVIIPVVLVGSLITSSFFLSNLQDKFFNENSGSYSSRQNSTIIDLLIISESPLTGRGFGNYSKIMLNYGAQGLNADSAPNTYTQIAANLGLPFLLIIILRLVKYLKSLPLSYINKFLLFAILVVLFSTQTFNLFAFFYVPLFMSFKTPNKITSLKAIKNER
jgi:hypothetical protein